MVLVMKHLQVACALIEDEGRLLAAQRSQSMSLPLKWEFPGGKIRDGEHADECLRRELLEELGIEVVIERPLPQTTHRYPTFTVTLHPFVCTIMKGEITLHEHAASCWLRPDELSALDWAEADRPLLEIYRKVSKMKTRGAD
jgi:8-oxo-dGTP diphosphatase